MRPRNSTPGKIPKNTENVCSSKTHTFNRGLTVEGQDNHCIVFKTHSMGAREPTPGSVSLAREVVSLYKKCIPDS